MQDPNCRPATGYPYPYPYPNPSQQPAASANGISYPYQNHNPSYAPQPTPRATFFRRLYFVFMVFILIIGVLFFIFFIAFRTQSPDVFINSLSLSNFNVSNNKVSGNWDLQLLVINPNLKISLHYDTFLCYLYYKRESLCNTRLQPLNQGEKDQTPINATLSVAGTYIGEELSESIGKDRAGKGSVEFDLRIISFVTFRDGAFQRRRYVTIYCDDMAVGVPTNSSSGKMVGSEKSCRSY